MWHFLFGLFAGGLLGLIVAALLGSAGHQDHREEVYQAYQSGFADGKRKGGRQNAV